MVKIKKNLSSIDVKNNKYIEKVTKEEEDDLNIYIKTPDIIPKTTLGLIETRNNINDIKIKVKVKTNNDEKEKSKRFTSCQEKRYTFENIDPEEILLIIIN